MDRPNLDELASRSLLFLVTSHVVLEFPKPRMPNVIDIGGLTTVAGKPLPVDLQHFLDGADGGVVLISFGSMLSTFPKEITDKFLSALSRLTSYRVVWRLANSTDMKLFSNVMASAWIPQNGILAHSNTKLFITHCGNIGQFEAIYNKAYTIFRSITIFSFLCICYPFCLFPLFRVLVLFLRLFLCSQCALSLSVLANFPPILYFSVPSKIVFFLLPSSDNPWYLPCLIIGLRSFSALLFAL